MSFLLVMMLCLPVALNAQDSSQLLQQTKLQQAKLLLSQAESNIKRNQYEQALVELDAAYQLTIITNDIEIGRSVLNALANIYYNTEQLEQAERYYLELIVLDEMAQDKPSLATSLYNLAHIFGSQQQLFKANEVLQRSLLLSQEIGDISGSSYTLKALGVNAQAQGDYHVGREYLSEALNGFEGLGDDRQVASVLRNLADVEQALGHHEQAVQYYQEALPVLALLSMDDALLRAYRGLSISYELLFDFEKAYIQHRAYTQLLTLQLEKQNAESMQHLQVQFETQRFADENDRLELLSHNQQNELAHQQSLQRLQWIILACSIGIIVLVIGFLLRSRQYAQQMRELATTDELTGLLNRRAIMNFGFSEWERSERFCNPMTCLMFDIDYFKSVNDTYGHAAGDIILKRVAAVLQETLRKTDGLGRFGGEEFLLLATETELEQAKVLAERIRKKVESIVHEELGGKQVTVSIGLAQKEEEKSLEELIKNADVALYKAKAEGRNQVIIFHDEYQFHAVPA